MRRREILRFGLGIGCAVFGTRPAWADYQTCAGEVVSNDEIRCPNGSIPSHSYGASPAPSAGTNADDRTGKLKPTGNARFVGIWHSNRQGLSYAHSYDVPGNSSMTGKIGLGPGDLTLGQDGGFTWNILGAPFGRWIAQRDGKSDFKLYQKSGVVWRGKILEDGKLAIVLDSSHSVFLTQ